MSAEFERLLPELVGNGVDFILIGGVAGIVHGSARVTYDVDLVYSRASENIRRLATALTPHSPYLRGAPPGLPFSWDEKTIHAGLNFTLTTVLGDIDLFGEIPGGYSYADLLLDSLDVEAFGIHFKCVDLPALIRIKKAAGRIRDLEAVAELQAILEERQKGE